MQRISISKKLISIVLISAVFLIPAASVRAGIFGSPEVEKIAGGSDSVFAEFFINGGPIVWFVLLPMSLCTVYLAIEHTLLTRSCRIVPPNVREITVSTLRECSPEQWATRLSHKPDFVSTAIQAACEAIELDSRDRYNRAADNIQENATGLLRKIEWTSIIGNVAPMIGLFGTVFGMIQAFQVMADGQPQPGELAKGISIALITTFWGLLVAIPALTIHGIFRNRIEKLAGSAACEAESVLNEMEILLRKHQQREMMESESESMSIQQINKPRRKEPSYNAIKRHWSSRAVQ